MPSSTSDQFAHLVRTDPSVTIDVLGPTIQYVTLPAETGGPCVMRGTIPAGVSIPLHSHGDPDTFVMLSGSVEGLVYLDRDFEWVGLCWRHLPRTAECQTCVAKYRREYRGDDHREHVEAGTIRPGARQAAATGCRHGLTITRRDRAILADGRTVRLLERHAGGERPRGHRGPEYAMTPLPQPSPPDPEPRPEPPTEPEPLPEPWPEPPPTNPIPPPEPFERHRHERSRSRISTA